MKFINIQENGESWRMEEKGIYYKDKGVVIRSFRKEKFVLKEG